MMNMMFAVKNIRIDTNQARKICNALCLGLGDSIVGLNDNMLWTIEVPLLTYSPDMVNGAAQNVQTTANQTRG